MIQIKSVFYNFPMVGLTPAVVIYDIFTVESLHAFSLGISRMLKEFASLIISYPFHFYTSTLTASWEKR